MTEYFDTHAHFEDADDVKAIYARAAESGVTRILAVGGDVNLNRNALRTPGCVALGLDCTQIGAELTPDERLAELRTLCALSAARLVAIGEIGLDGHYNAETLSQQVPLCAAELALANEHALPVVVHTREADDTTLGVLREVPWMHSEKLRGVIHSFTGTPAFARQLLDLGFMISFSGIATFNRGENVRESARYVPDDRILIETDAPFLAPVPLRGKRCEPAFVRYTCARIAQERKITDSALAALTFANGVSLFG